MSGSLPTVRANGLTAGAQALYPITRRIEFLTDVAMGLNATEQRAKHRPPLTRFVLPYTKITLADMIAMRNFFLSQKGTFDSTWSFTLGSNSYSGLTFEDPSFHAVEEDETRTTYSFTLKARQTKNPGVTTGSAGGTFPALANGTTTELPYTQIRRFAVTLNDNPESGTRYAWTWYEGGMDGFPQGALWGWELNYPVISDADLATLETFFRAQWGMWSAFSFIDPDPLTTLNSLIDGSVTLAPVVSTANLPPVPFTIKIDSEQLTVTAVGGGSTGPLTVTRAVNGTSPGIHIGGAPLYFVCPDCRFGSDAMEITHRDIDQNSVTLYIQQFGDATMSSGITVTVPDGVYMVLSYSLTKPDPSSWVVLSVTPSVGTGFADYAAEPLWQRRYKVSSIDNPPDLSTFVVDAKATTQLIWAADPVGPGGANDTTAVISGMSLVYVSGGSVVSTKTPTAVNVVNPGTDPQGQCTASGTTGCTFDIWKTDSSSNPPTIQFQSFA